jgi:prepilin signal peptidase PulO-like enzyme (type II secretory pathway)
MLALGIPAALGAIMVLGATRGSQGIGALKLPFLFVFVVLAAGFCLALALPANEAAGARLVLGLPIRASIIIYGIGLLPIVVLPVAYAITFDTQTLSESDIQRVRDLAKTIREQETDK